MAHITLRIARSCAVALLSLAAAGAARAGAAPTLAAPSLGGTLTSGPGAPARVLVTPAGHAYVVLTVEAQQRDGVLSCDVLYLAGDEPVELTRPGAREHLATAGSDLVAALSPLFEVAPVERLSITALFGKPGRVGVAERLWYARQEGGWRAEARPSERASAQVPDVPLNMIRDAQKEASAHAIAAGFISDADRADYDAAWAKTSAVVKAAMSKSDFERSLAELARARRGEDGALYLCFPIAASRFLPGTAVEAWVARGTSDGPIIEALALRLDDDLQWRVAAVVQMTRTTLAARVPRAAAQQAIEAAGAL